MRDREKERRKRKERKREEKEKRKKKCMIDVRKTWKKDSLTLKEKLTFLFSGGQRRQRD